MKSYLINICMYCLILLMPAAAIPVRAQKVKADTTASTDKSLEGPKEADNQKKAYKDSVKEARASRRAHRYDTRILRYKKHWESLIPSHTLLQFAGNMGLLSVGTGWDYGRHRQWETDVLFGILPKYDSDRTKITFTLKQSYIPWSFRLGESHFNLEPLSTGMYMNTVFGDEFWVKEPERYPEGYYGFSSKVRFHIYLGQRLTYDIAHGKRFWAKSVTLFYEVSTCDLYVVSAFTNKHLKPKDYLSLSFGVKMQLL